MRHTYKRPERFEPLRIVEDHSEEFLEMMNNVGDLSNPSSPPSPSHEAQEHSSPRASGHKRSVSIREDSQEPPTHKAKHGDSSDGMFCHEVLSAAPEGAACPVDV